MLANFLAASGERAVTASWPDLRRNSDRDALGAIFPKLQTIFKGRLDFLGNNAFIVNLALSSSPAQPKSSVLALLSVSKPYFSHMLVTGA
jgi:hypothetical protein